MNRIRESFKFEPTMYLELLKNIPEHPVHVVHITHHEAHLF